MLDTTTLNQPALLLQQLNPDRGAEMAEGSETITSMQFQKGKGILLRLHNNEDPKPRDVTTQNPGIDLCNQPSS